MPDPDTEFLNLPSPFHASSRDSRSPPSVLSRTGNTWYSRFSLSSIPEHSEELDEGLLAQGWGTQEVRKKRRKRVRMAMEVAALFLAALVLGSLVVVCARMGRGVMDHVGGGAWLGTGGL
jgi:hypothetical protein